MHTYNISKSFRDTASLTTNVKRVIRMFGLDLQRLKQNAMVHACTIYLAPGRVCFITGPSGAGKSVIFRELMSQIPEHQRVNLDDIALPDSNALVDCIEGSFLEILQSLSIAGLSDAFTILTAPARLSEGQKYRFRLAKAIASDAGYVFADEFCSNLDRITAAAVAYQIRKYARKSDKIFILASSHDDILADLLPDVLVIKHLSGSTEVQYKTNL